MADYAKRIEALEAELTKLKKELEEQEQEAPPVWAPDYMGEYFTIDSGRVECFSWYEDSSDEAYLAHGEVFRTKQEAKDHLRYLKLKETMRREQKRANGDWEWRAGEFYYSILNENNRVKGWHLCWSDIPSEFGKWQCREKLNEVIERHREELEWYFTEYLPSVN